MTGEAWIDTVRLARDCGDVSRLFPPDVDSLVDMPYTVHDAINRALTILSWEELPLDERPPHAIWNDPEELQAHFKRVQRERDRKYGTGDSDDIDDPVQNDAAKALLV